MKTKFTALLILCALPLTALADENGKSLSDQALNTAISGGLSYGAVRYALKSNREIKKDFAKLFESETANLVHTERVVEAAKAREADLFYGTKLLNEKEKLDKEVAELWKLEVDVPVGRASPSLVVQRMKRNQLILQVNELKAQLSAYNDMMDLATAQNKTEVKETVALTAKILAESKQELAAAKKLVFSTKTESTAVNAIKGDIRMSRVTGGIAALAAIGLGYSAVSEVGDMIHNPAMIEFIGSGVKRAPASLMLFGNNDSAFATTAPANVDSAK